MAHLLESRQSNSAAEQLLKLAANPFQSSIQIDAFWASLGTSAGVTLALAIIFSLLRPRHTLVYAPKTKHADSKHAPPPMGRGPFSWFKPVMKAKESDLVGKIGMDAVLFLRFTRMLRNIFGCLGVVGVLIMIPVNVATSNKSIEGASSAFTIMTPQFVFGNGIWAQVVVAYAINIVVAVFLWLNYKKVYQLRRQYFESPDYQRSLHARSVLIRHIPGNMRSDDGILHLTNSVNPTGVQPKPMIGRNVKALPDLIEEHEETVRELESVLAKYLKNPDRLPVNRPTMKAPKKYKGQTSGGKVDSIEYLTERIRQLERHINDVRESIDRRDAMPYGFASWDQISQAHAVAFAASKNQPQGAQIVLAPKPQNIIWKNLPLSKAARARKSWSSSIWITILTIIWTPLNAGIAIFLSNLSNLGSVWPGFQRQLYAHRAWWSLVQGIAAPALTSLVYLVLPILFRRLQIRAGDVTKTSRERHVLRNLYQFFTFNNLIIFSLFSAIWQYVTTVIKASQSTSDVWKAIVAGQFYLTVTINLCQISPFWVTWILQRNMGAAIDLAQLWTLFYVWFSKTFRSPTPRQRIEWTAPPAFDYASYYNYFLFYATVAFCFATLQPIILVVTAVYFTIDTVLKKYLLMYVFITKTESGGQFWRTLVNRLMFAVILSDVVIGVVVKARGTWTMIGVLGALVVFMLGFKWYCRRTFDPGMHYYHRAGELDPESQSLGGHGKAIVRASAKFRHPVLDKPLMTPMVSAKAKHVLAQIYSGRLGSTGGDDFTDIALEPMSQTGKPKQDAPFELVPEAQQDFAYYKNRSDFREEGGEIYGRPEDLISERSGTPMSMMTDFSRTDTPHNDTTHMGRSHGQKLEAPSESEYRDFSENQPIAPIARRPINQQLHPALRAQLEGRTMETEGDLSARHGPYTDPNDDRTTLLRNVDGIHTPNGEFMSLDRWQADQSAPNSVPGTPKATEGGSYDYFRHGRI